MRPLARFTRGAAAVTVLGGLVAGVPVFLAVAVGWPLPRRIPDWSEVAATFGGEVPLDPGTVTRLLACIVWLAWAQVLAAVVVEATALARGGLAGPVRGLGCMQRLAGPLLSVAALLLPSTTAHAKSPAGPVPRQATVAAVSIGPSPAPATPAGTPADPAPARTIEYTVRRRDTLWALAERYVAPGGGTTEIAAAVEAIFDLNVGAPQPDGMPLTDPGILHPGWVLAIPAVPDRSDPAAVTVERGDSLWRIAEAHLGDGHRYPELVALNAGAPQPNGQTLSDPALIRPGWTIRLPDATETAGDPGNPPPGTLDPFPGGVAGPGTASAVPQGEPGPAPGPAVSAQGTAIASSLPTSVPTSPPAGATPTTTAAAPARPPTSQPAGPRPAAPRPRGGTGTGSTERNLPAGLLGVAGGLLGAGLVALVGTRRRKHRLRRQPGTELPPLPATAAPVLAELDLVDLDRAGAVAYLLRDLPLALDGAGPLSVPVLATVTGTDLEVLFDRAYPGPIRGWASQADGRIWRAPLPLGPAAGGDGIAGVPGLVSVGAIDNGGVMVNLEAAGAIGLTGDPDAVAALAASITIELALSPLADRPTVHLVGDRLLGGAGQALPGLARHPDLAAALAATDDWAATVAQAMAATGAGTAFELRCRAPEETWPLAVLVIDAASVDDTSQAGLGPYCAAHPGVAVLIAGACPDGATEIVVTGTEFCLPAFGLRGTVQGLAAGTPAVIDELLDASDQDAMPPILSAPTPASDNDLEPTPGPDWEPGPLTLFEPDVEKIGEAAAIDEANPERPTITVRVLGPVEVDGADVRPQELAILAYLALHPGATGDAVRDAVWGGRAPSRERFQNALHELRKAIGKDRLPYATDGRLRLNDVACDAIDAEHHIAAAATAAPEAAVAELRAALEAVTGPPLSFEHRHRRHFGWIDFGNHASRWDRIIGDAAHQLASLALAAGDAALATWAAERGLLASPANEALTYDLTASHLAAGDRRAAETVVEAYTRVLEELGVDEPADALHELLETPWAS